MGYVIALILVLLLVAGFVTFMVINASRSGGPSDIAAPDSSPLGDSAEHAGEQQEGATVDDPESGDADPGQGDAPRVGDPGPELAGTDPEPLSDRPR